tara:strand:- start:267 stop:722 length:456 start_codon:yes stop_codon:yes gene_type:complete
MSSVNGPAVVIYDADGDTVTVTGGKLDVNAYLSTTDNNVLDAILADTDSIGAIRTLLTTPTAIISIANADVDTSAELLYDDSGSIRRMDIQAHRDNAGIIYVGDSGVANDGSGGGISLRAGDYYSIAIDQYSDVYVVATIPNQKVHANAWV